MCALTAQHVIVGIICDGVDVWRNLRAPLAFVGSHHRCGVDGKPFVWIHRHTEQPRVGLRKEEDIRLTGYDPSFKTKMISSATDRVISQAHSSPRFNY